METDQESNVSNPPTISRNYYYPGCGWPVPQFMERKRIQVDNSLVGPERKPIKAENSHTGVQSDDNSDVHASRTVDGCEGKSAGQKPNFSSSRYVRPSVSSGSEAGPCRSSDCMNICDTSNRLSSSKASDRATSKFAHSQQRRPLERKPKTGPDFSPCPTMGYDPSRKYSAFPNQKPRSFSTERDHSDSYRSSERAYNGNHSDNYRPSERAYNGNHSDNYTPSERAYNGNHSDNYRPSERAYNENDKSRFSSPKNGNFETPNEIPRGPRTGNHSSSSDSLDKKKQEFGVFGLNVHRDKYNSPDFETQYDNAMFYVIKSYSEDDVHKCLKFDVWSSTAYGNKKLDAAFEKAEAKAKSTGSTCPIFLFFSVNRSGQFIGMAEMIGKVDFKKDMDFWQLDKWIGFFPVKWHILKDIPHSHLRHILLENNENKPVTFTRDTQEIEMKPGLEMLNIFKNYSAKTSLIDDYTFYENREKTLLSRENNQTTTDQGIDIYDDYNYNGGYGDLEDSFVKPQRRSFQDSFVKPQRSEEHAGNKNYDQPDSLINITQNLSLSGSSTCESNPFRSSHNYNSGDIN